MIIEAARRRDDEISALTRSALQEQEREYQSFAGSVEQAFNSQLRGLVSGTETWRTAFRKVLDDLLIRFIEWTETTVAHHLVGEAMKTSATAAGAAARAEAEEAGAAASMGAQGAAMIRSILSSAAETFAGVFGFLSPIMGPLAAGPAAAAQATVAGMAGAVASADIGMWQVPKDMLTLVHHNELIMPAAEAGAFRSLLGDGGQTAATTEARRAYSSDDQRPRLGARRRLRLAVDAGKQRSHAERDRPGRPARRGARAPAAEAVTQIVAASTFCRRAASSSMTRFRSAARSAARQG